MNINISLTKDFVSQYNRLQQKYGSAIARLNGFDDNQLSYTDFIDNFIDKQKNVADTSIDSNANVSHKDIVSLEREMPKAHSKLLAFNKIYHEIQKAFGFNVANEWLEAEWSGQLYMHDAPSASFRHYCFAHDLKDLAEKGLYFISGQNPCPANHLTTFVDFVKAVCLKCTNQRLILLYIVPKFKYFPIFCVFLLTKPFRCCILCVRYIGRVRLFSCHSPRRNTPSRSNVTVFSCQNGTRSISPYHTFQYIFKEDTHVHRTQARRTHHQFRHSKDRKRHQAGL